MLLLKTLKEIKSQKIPLKKRDTQKKNNARLSDSLNLFQEAYFNANKTS